MYVLMLLEAEHESLRKLLDAAEAELARLEDGLECDRALLGALAAYWRDYPDVVHHRKEERVLRALAQRTDATSLGERITGEHEHLAAIDEELTQALATGEPDDEGLAAILRKFVDENRAHLAYEESELFATARRRLSGEDWEAIEFDLIDRDSPLMERATEARYNILCDAILEMSARRAAQDHARRLRDYLFAGDTAGLDGVTTVEQFNDFVGREVFGGDLVLRGTARAGWTLESSGTTLAEIPECEEARAVWCAYFYLLGAERGYPPRQAS